MFKNAGKKLRILVQISFFIFACADIFLPLGIYNTRAIDEMTCIITIIIALLATYLFHLFFYALAELMENVYNIKKDIEENSEYVNDALLFISKTLNQNNNANNIENEEKGIDINISADED